MSRYVEAFSLDKPKESFEIVQRRLKRAQGLDEEVANYFRDRAAVEEKYASELQRLAKKHVLAPTDKDFVGTFTEVWDQLLKSIVEVATLHSTYAKEVSEKMEKPVRGRAQVDADWAKLKQYEADFGRATKDYEDKNMKYLKAAAKAKKGAASEKSDKKVADAQAAKEAAQEHWTPQAIQAFERFQTMDESRLEFLKDTMSKYADLESKHDASKNAISDSVLAAVMSFDVPHEIATFCATKSNNDGQAPAAMISDGASSTNTSRKNSVVLPPNGRTLSRDTVSLAPSSTNGPNQPQVDDEGYSIPATGSSSLPWDNPANGNLDGDDEDNASLASQKIKVAIRKETIVESPEDMSKALRQFQNVLGPSGARNAAKRASRRISLSGSDNPPSSDPKSLTTPRNFSNLSERDLDVWGSLSPNSATSSIPSLEPTKGTPTVATPTYTGPVRVRVAVTEIVNALIKTGHVEKLLVTGEVLLSSVSEQGQFVDTAGMESFKIRVANANQLAHLVPNDAFVRAADPAQPDLFIVDCAALRRSASESLSSVPIFKYQVRIDGDPARSAPLLVNAVWKCEPTQTSLLLAYQLNASAPLTNPTTTTATQSPLLTNIRFLVPVTAGGEISTVRTSPTGIWNPERKAILWKVGDMAVASDQPTKLLARMDTTEMAVPGTVIVQFSAPSASLGAVGVLVEAGERVEVVETTRALSAGKYGAS